MKLLLSFNEKEVNLNTYLNEYCLSHMKFAAILPGFRFHVRQYSFNYDNDDKTMFGTYLVLPTHR